MNFYTVYDLLQSEFCNRFLNRFSKVMLIYNGIESTMLASTVDHAQDEKALQQHWNGQKTYVMCKYSQIHRSPWGRRAGGEIEESPHH